MKAPVNELLLYCRLPYFFWTEVNGGRTPWDNPGHSVISLCAAKLNQQVIEVPAEGVASVDECKQFTTSLEGISSVIQWIDSSSARLIAKANELNSSSKVVSELTALVNHIGSARGMFSAIFGGVSPTKHLDPVQEIALLFLQALIDIKTDIEKLEAAIIAASEPSAPTKA